MPSARQQSEAPASPLRPETLLGSIAVVLVVNLVQRSLGFGRAVLFCRWLDPDELGRWEMAYGFLILAAPLVVLGLPGSFGRYLERYRAEGQLRLFLRRTTTWTFGLAAVTLLALAWRRDLLAGLVFGDSERSGLVLGVLACLAVVILHHFLEAVFAGLRMFRVVSGMHFVQSVTFAAASLLLIATASASAGSVVAGYAAGCVVSIVAVAAWCGRQLDVADDHAAPVRHRDFWPPLMRFAVWVWVTNLLTNVFSIIDRYMIVHCGGCDAEHALVQVGNYHTSTIVPILLVSVANLVVGAMTPHLSHEWEAGHRRAVSARINLVLKLTTLGMLAAGVVVLMVCPTLFRLAFGEKYAAGLAVLPWTLTGCVWFALLLVSQTYVWCAEKTRQATLPLAVGLAANVLLNLMLLPAWGLVGAVVATAYATLLTLAGQLLVNARAGMVVHRSTALVIVAPLLLAGGPMVAAIGATALVTLAIARGWILTPRERAEVMGTIAERAGRILPRPRGAV